MWSECCCNKNLKYVTLTLLPGSHSREKTVGGGWKGDEEIAMGGWLKGNLGCVLAECLTILLPMVT